MKKRALSMILAITLIAGTLMIFPTAVAGHPFSDVPAWADEYVDVVYRSGIMQGVGGGRFGADQPLTREQLIVTLYRMSGNTDIEIYDIDKVCYDNDDVSDWAKNAVKWAFLCGITSGVKWGENTYFMPKNNVTREEAAKFFITFADRMGYELPTDGDAVIADMDTVSSWAAEYVERCVAAGIISGDEKGNFSPAGVTTRAAAAKMIACLPQEDVITKVDKKMQYLDGYDFNGRTFVWIGGGSQAPDVELEIGDVLNDSLFIRQREVEKMLNVDIYNYSPEQLTDDYASRHPVVESVMLDVLAGTNAYDAGYGTTAAVNMPLAMENCLTDLKTVGGIDLNREWWELGVTDDYSIGGKLYFATGDIVTSNYTSASAMVYNKSLARDYDIENLYSLVENGKWTMDKMLEVASVIPENTDGRGVYRFSQPDGFAMILAADEGVIYRDSAGAPLVEESLPDALWQLSEKLAPVFGNDNLTAHVKGKLTGTYESYDEKYGYESAEAMFVDGKVLFSFMTTGDIIEMRGEEIEFGILPLPKGSEKLGDYISYADPWALFNVFVPRSSANKTFAGTVLEAMAVCGYKYLRPVYYDRLLCAQSTFDYESQDMISIICDSQVHDLIGGFEAQSWGSLGRILDTMIEESSAGVASRYKMNAKLYNYNVERAVSELN